MAARIRLATLAALCLALTAGEARPQNPPGAGRAGRPAGGAAAAAATAPTTAAATAAATAATGPATSAAPWVTFVDRRNHFRLDRPPTWTVNAEPTTVAHYSQVVLALNSGAAEGLTVRELPAKADRRVLDAAAALRQVPAGAAYVDVGWFDGPAQPQFGPDVREMAAADLAGPLEESRERRAGDLVTREVRFSKWGKAWVLTVRLHEPVAAEVRADVERVLASFRFDGVPAGDEVWALGLAREHLPPEADPDLYTRQGGSSERYCQAKADGDDVLVTFTKHVGDGPAKRWRYRVTAKGDVVEVRADD